MTSKDQKLTKRLYKRDSNSVNLQSSNTERRRLLANTPYSIIEPQLVQTPIPKGGTELEDLSFSSDENNLQEITLNKKQPRLQQGQQVRIFAKNYRFSLSLTPDGKARPASSTRVDQVGIFANPTKIQLQTSGNTKTLANHRPTRSAVDLAKLFDIKNIPQSRFLPKPKLAAIANNGRQKLGDGSGTQKKRVRMLDHS